MEIHHYKFHRITLDPEKCFGKPCIRGLRMPVASILSYLSSGMTIDEILTEGRNWSEKTSTRLWAMPLGRLIADC